MAIYDSAKAREIAEEMNALRQKLENSIREYRQALAQTDALSGNTAEAMEESLQQLIATANGLEDEIGNYSHLMHRYANTLEQLDQQLANEF